MLITQYQRGREKYGEIKRNGGRDEDRLGARREREREREEIEKDGEKKEIEKDGERRK